ncbi:hypothetical protein K7X08_032252 [Anisodus acutangulus]|uniref:EndoU domain-containing protein n=1 Tax=Anisodus acutangulus TaxID=402998 RepID=A0A9Q1MFZ3_9SOLA|nr:hypothetical protein K7X08_032252 [Anisodus acutangulus]
MEGLVKGVLNVTLGNDENDRDNQDRDEQSRSTWAQVVTGEQEDEGVNSDHRHGYNRERYGRNEESRPHMMPQKASPQGYERNEDERRDDFNQSSWNQKEDEGNNDGWETVQKNPTKRHQQVKMDYWDNYKKPLDEQDYSNEVEYGVDLKPTEDELSDLSTTFPAKDYHIDCGEGKKVYQKDDMAEGCLFSRLSDDVFNKPNYSRFCSLLDNYNPHQGCKENVTPEEKREQTAFIEEISRTAPIKYLISRMMTHLWFDLYSRGGTSASSSAFEHVFVGEIKECGEKSVSGFHNWLQFYLEEAKGNVDYQGYIFPRRLGEIPDSETQLLTIQFEWNGVLKSVSSSLIGVSPEFEVAIYTLLLCWRRREPRRDWSISC